MISKSKMEQGKFSPSQLVNNLLALGIKAGFANKIDCIYLRNLILSELGEINFVDDQQELNLSLADTLDLLVQIAIDNKKIVEIESDNLKDKIMGIILPLPSVVEKKFRELVKQENSEAACDYLFNLSKNSYYIKTDRISENINWDFNSPRYGKLNLTINCSKPEKSPQEIAQLKKLTSSSYPKCSLCLENIGCEATANRSSRQNLRYVNFQLDSENIFLQYSPYGYFPEHMVVNSSQHKAMEVTPHGVRQSLKFVQIFPFYFLGSNSDIPIVGGSILNHQHFQGGRYVFPLEKRPQHFVAVINGVRVSIVDWPVSTILLQGGQIDNLVKTFEVFQKYWYNYDNKKLNIIAKSKDGTRQNAISILSRYEKNSYSLYLFLRNNATNDQFTEGIFHVHPEHWNIKKENIGIIEQLGLAILPGRLKNELNMLNDIFTNKLEFPSSMEIHRKWFKEVSINFNPNANIEFAEHLKNEVGKTFVKCLENCGLFLNQNDDFVQMVKQALEVN